MSDQLWSSGLSCREGLGGGQHAQLWCCWTSDWDDPHSEVSLCCRTWEWKTCGRRESWKFLCKHELSQRVWIKDLSLKDPEETRSPWRWFCWITEQNSDRNIAHSSSGLQSSDEMFCSDFFKVTSLCECLNEAAAYVEASGSQQQWLKLLCCPLEENMRSAAQIY